MTHSLHGIQRIVTSGLCHRCGSCAGICPSGVLRPGLDYYPDWHEREGACTDCGLCLRVCSGVGFSFPSFSGELFGREPSVNEGHGFILKAFLGYAADPDVRRGATSGGIASRLPLFLLERGRVKGVFSVGNDPAQPWKPRARIARTREEVLSGRLSKYPACSLNHLFSELKGEEGPFAYVGLPCHIHGQRKMERCDRSIREKIALRIGLFCHSCLDHQFIRDAFNIYRIEEKHIACMEYRGGKLPGYIRAGTHTDEWVYLPYPRLGPEAYRPNAKECLTLFFKFYSPPRCRLCIDATSECADIAVGDPWFKGWEAEKKLHEGYSLILARTERGLRVLEEARDAGAIVLEPFPVERARMSHLPMIRSKRSRAFFTIALRRKRGAPVPDYGFEKTFSWGEMFRAKIHHATYFAADRPLLRKMVVRVILSRTGRVAVWTVFFRRRILQALWEKGKRLFVSRRGRNSAKGEASS